MRINARAFIDWLIPDKKIADEAFEAVGSPLAATIPENWKNENNRKEPIFDVSQFDGSDEYPRAPDVSGPSPQDVADVLDFLDVARATGRDGVIHRPMISGGRVSSKHPNLSQAPRIADGKLDGADLLKLMR